MNLLTLNISTSSHQPFVLNEFPYEYPESQLYQLKNVTVQGATGTSVSSLKEGKSNVRVT